MQYFFDMTKKKQFFMCIVCLALLSYQKYSIQRLYFTKFRVNLKLTNSYRWMLFFTVPQDTLISLLVLGSIRCWVEFIHLRPATHSMAAGSTLCHWIWLKSNIKENCGTVAIISLVQNFEQMFLLVAVIERRRMLCARTAPSMKALRNKRYKICFRMHQVLMDCHVKRSRK